MSRFIRFRCHACGATMQERLVRPTALELRCTNAAECGLILLVVTCETIPTEPTTTTAVRSRLELALDHGPGWRCYGCGKRLQAVGKGAWLGPTPDRRRCSRCFTWHLFGSRGNPPALPPYLAEPPAAVAPATPVPS